MYTYINPLHYQSYCFHKYIHTLYMIHTYISCLGATGLVAAGAAEGPGDALSG